MTEDIAEAIVARLLGSEELVALLGEPDAIYLHHPQAPAALPCLTYRLTLKPEHRRHTGELTLTAWARTAADARAVMHLAEEALGAGRIKEGPTCGWTIPFRPRSGYRDDFNESTGLRFAERTLEISAEGDPMHNHDDRYHTEAEIAAMLAALAMGQVSKAIDDTWEGDDADNRTIDLGDDYDLVLVWRTTGASGVQHLAMAYAFRDVYGVFYEASPSAGVHHGTADCACYWQGKMFGEDSNKIKLGSTGDDNQGSNRVGVTYRLLGLKFSAME